MLLKNSARLCRFPNAVRGTAMRSLSSSSQAQHGKSYTYGQPFQDVSFLHYVCVVNDALT
jgi:hypothetical protein